MELLAGCLRRWWTLQVSCGGHWLEHLGWGEAQMRPYSWHGSSKRRRWRAQSWALSSPRGAMHMLEGLAGKLQLQRTEAVPHCRPAPLPHGEGEGVCAESCGPAQPLGPPLPYKL